MEKGREEGVKEGISGGTIKTKDHFRDLVETDCTE